MLGRDSPLFPLPEALSLFADKLLVIEIIDFHRIANLVKCLCRNFASLLAALAQYFIDSWNVLFQFSPPCPYRSKCLLHNCKQEPLHLHISQYAPAIMILECVQILIIGRYFAKCSGLQKASR